MLESLLGVIAIVALIIIVSKQQSRLGLLERELGALRSLVLSGAAPAPAAKAAEISVETASEPVAPEALAAAMVDTGETVPAMAAAAAETAVSEELPIAANAEGEDTEAGPWSGKQAPAAPTSAPAREKPDIETALGTRWAVWVGGLALAFGGVFLIRYSIESGGGALRLGYRMCTRRDELVTGATKSKSLLCLSWRRWLWPRVTTRPKGGRVMATHTREGMFTEATC